MPNKLNKPKIALVYDKVNTPYGGAEHVLKAIGEIYPKAPLFTSVYSKNKSKWASSFKVRPSFLQKIKIFRNNHQLASFLMPLAFESINLDKFDIIISITSAQSKGVLTKPHQLHICYMLTPTRYLYSHKNEYLASKKILSFFPIKLVANLVLNYLTWWDKAASLRPDIIIPISKLIKSRIKKYYNLNTTNVIYPPVNKKLRKKSKNEGSKNAYYLSISRLVDYKKVDLSIKACLELNRTLVVVGSGIQEKELKTIAKNKYLQRNEDESIKDVLKRAKKENKKIIFTQKIAEHQLNYLLENCKALLMPGEEDFGITGLEASIFGKPVIVFDRSGVTELLTNKVNSVFIKKETKREVVKAILKLEKIKFDSKLIESNTKIRSTEEFKKEFKEKVQDSWEKFLCHI